MSSADASQDQSLDLTISLACDYDHTNDLLLGRVPIRGVTPRWVITSVLHSLQITGRRTEWDVAEVSLTKYLIRVAAGDDSLVALPVFPSRVFRHTAIYVHAESALSTPKQLNGRRIGITDWTQAASLYARGLLASEYGVDLASVRWVQAGLDEPWTTRPPHLADLPEPFQGETRLGASLGELLAQGSVDAVISSRPPALPAQGGARRLFAQSRQAEGEYFARTRVFPIMHAIVVRRALVDSYPWLAASLFEAFVRARDLSVDRMRDEIVSRVPVPWMPEWAQAAWESLGGQQWPYGISANRPSLDALLDYSRDQGLVKRTPALEELFMCLEESDSGGAHRW